MSTPPVALEQLPEMLKVKDVAAFLGCGLSTVYDMIASRRLPCVTVGRRGRRIPRERLAALLVEPPPPESPPPAPEPAPLKRKVGRPPKRGSRLEDHLVVQPPPEPKRMRA